MLNGVASSASLQAQHHELFYAIMPCLACVACEIHLFFGEMQLISLKQCPVHCTMCAMCLLCSRISCDVATTYRFCL